MEMHSVESTESGEKSSSKMSPLDVIEPGPFTLMPWMLLSELIPYLAGNLRTLDPYIVMLY